ncbi:MAG: multiheme c-type cytochrome [Planctomycetota bacterium]
MHDERNLEGNEGQERRQRGWRDKAGRWTAGLTLLLTVTGLSIHFLPFSVFNQHSVLVHTVVGLGFVVPFAIYLVRHVRAYWDFPGTHVKLSGWALAAALLACTVSGLVITWQGAMSTRMGASWQTLHVIGTYVLVAVLGAHLVPLYLRLRRGSVAAPSAELREQARAHGYGMLWQTFAGIAVVLGLTALVRPVTMIDEFPEGYQVSSYEGATAFSPSLGRTSTGGAFDARTFAGSASCGTADCHAQIYHEWQSSAHRYASMDAGFQAIQNVMATQNGADSTRYCGGCHDPISLFSGTKNIGVEHLSSLDGYQEGISCLACHAIVQTDTRGNADYVIARPERYVFEQREGGLSTFLADFLIRTYPEQHVASLSRTMFKTPEFCAACHLQFIDEEVNQVGWVQLQNQFGNWEASRWNRPDDPELTVECRECHMPLVASHDPAAGDDADLNRSQDDGKHRSHRFLGANQFMPLLHELEGAAEHVALTEQWLRGELPIPEIAHKWTTGPAVPIELEVPEAVAAGDTLTVRVHVINNKVGHDFPTGPLDIIQAWIELTVTDAAGQVVFHSGQVDEENFIEPGTFMFKAEPVDRYGNLIDRHNLWEMVGVRFKRSLFPGSEDVASYAFSCAGVSPGEAPDGLMDEANVELPAELQGPLTVSARLLYRKFDQFLLNFVFGEDSGLVSPITEVSSAEVQVQLLPRGR